MVRCQLAAILTAAEEEAISAYRADSTYFHVTKQGWIGSLFYRDSNRINDDQPCRHPDYSTFLNHAAAHQSAIDSAVKKSILTDDAVVYSGHGRGTAVFGALCAAANKFVGLCYHYPGYISTTAIQCVAEEKFIADRAYEGSRPTLLEFRLGRGYPILDMNFVCGAGSEFEFLIGRNAQFKIVEAKRITLAGVNDEVIHLIFVPPTDDTV